MVRLLGNTTTTAPSGRYVTLVSEAPENKNKNLMVNFNDTILNFIEIIQIYNPSL
jgi:hypothetical protein